MKLYIRTLTKEIMDEQKIVYRFVRRLAKNVVREVSETTEKL